VFFIRAWSPGVMCVNPKYQALILSRRARFVVLASHHEPRSLGCECHSDPHAFGLCFVCLYWSTIPLTHLVAVFEPGFLRLFHFPFALSNSILTSPLLAVRWLAGITRSSPALYVRTTFLPTN